MPRHICPVVYNRELPRAACLCPRRRLLNQVDAVADQVFQGLLAWGVEPRADDYAETILLVEAVQNDGLFNEQRFDTHGINHISLELQAPIDPLLKHLIRLVDLILPSH